MAEVLFTFLILYLQHAAISTVGPVPVHLFGSQTIGLTAKGSLVAKRSWYSDNR